MAVESSSQLGMALADQAPHHSEMCSYTQQELLITGCNFRDLYMFLRSKKNEYISIAQKMDGLIGTNQENEDRHKFESRYNHKQ
ncbi:uncharacterized protein [Oryctolagus cuniculus]|uniref:uncharacterized protein isoform X2 n=1 Tax=Oryctolagus cuniculus TaxID=9986 RepID=UPI00387950D1